MRGRVSVAVAGLAGLAGLAMLAGGAGCGLVANLSADYVAGATDASSLATADARADGGGGSESGVVTGDGGGSGDASADGAETGVAACDLGTLDGPTMVPAASPGGGPPFCIDSTEVTEADYAVFLTFSGKPAQPEPCAWNDNFDPTTNGTGECQNYDFTSPSRPVVCVDWCDATAYCAMSGKRLCGRIGGGSLAPPDAADPAKDQWLAACNGGDTKRVFPYGATYVAGRCVDTAAAPSDVKSHVDCVGTAAGLFDMSGNVSEWEDACDAAGADTSGQNCKVRGGDFSAPAGDKSLKCAEVGPQQQRKFTGLKVGFRCCK